MEPSQQDLGKEYWIEPRQAGGSPQLGHVHTADDVQFNTQPIPPLCSSSLRGEGGGAGTRKQSGSWLDCDDLLFVHCSQSPMTFHGLLV